MSQLEDLTVNSRVRGIIPGDEVTIRHLQMIGTQAANVTYADSQGKTGTQLLYRDREAELEIISRDRPFSFDGDGAAFRLTVEALRIQMGHLFDPLLAVNASLVDPLPHQITAVYGELLERQPLRFVLADDPGSGKTIMTGLFIKELILRGDVQKCLIVTPGSLVEQWQDELDEKFDLPFEILTNDALEAARTGNWFLEHDYCLCRLDKLSRNEDVQTKLKAIDWDLIVVDEAHKMSASWFGGEAKYTKRYRLGQLLSEQTRHFLLLTATPHNGKEDDFQLFMALLDGDRFEGRFREGIHTTTATDLIRRMVKEDLVTMEGKRLFPERFAYTLHYELSTEEAALYQAVTEYVREEFNRADNLNNDGRRGTVGFALTILQRRLASSPAAIHDSLRRRRERLEKRLREERLQKRGLEAHLEAGLRERLDDEDLEDLEDAPEAELEVAEEEILDSATTAQTIAELEEEIKTLAHLEAIALKVRNSGQDTKWKTLRETLEDNPEMRDAEGNRRKLVIFTEHRDTLNYLEERLRHLIGNPEAIVTISGQTRRELRRQIQERFTSDPDVLVLVATDAAGEGINLQRAHLMVNYDLPWNPNRLEQRFGRIHRIGQKEVCHLWNLVSQDTREGEVYYRLLQKLELARDTLEGKVFDVLGKLFRGTPLRELLIRAIRYGDEEQTRAFLEEVIEQETDMDHLRQLLDQRALARDAMNTMKIQRVREEMEMALARRLQPHFIKSFFREAFRQYGGQLLAREKDRFEIRHVPAEIRIRDRQIGQKAPLLRKYERVTFERDAIRTEGKPVAALISPGHPLLESVIDLTLERHRPLLKQGSILLDRNDNGFEPRVLFLLQHSICDSRHTREGQPLVISRQMQFMEVDHHGKPRSAGYAPHLDYLPLDPQSLQRAQEWVETGDAPFPENLEDLATGFAVERMVPHHLKQVRIRREERIQRTMREVKSRLTAEIGYWDNRANEIRAKEEAGKTPRLNSRKAAQRADELSNRLRRRLEELEREKQIHPQAPVVLGGALILPQGLMDCINGMEADSEPGDALDTRESERLAMERVLQTERDLGFEPEDVGALKLGYDIQSLDPDTGRLRFIEVKGRAVDASTVTLTSNEIRVSLNSPDRWFLAIVPIENGNAGDPRYIQSPFETEPEFMEVSRDFNLNRLLEVSEDPAHFGRRSG